MHDRFHTAQREVCGVQHFFRETEYYSTGNIHEEAKIGAYYSEQETYIHQSHVACAYLCP